MKNFTLILLALTSTASFAQQPDEEWQETVRRDPTIWDRTDGMPGSSASQSAPAPMETELLIKGKPQKFDFVNANAEARTANYETSGDGYLYVTNNGYGVHIEVKLSERDLNQLKDSLYNPNTARISNASLKTDGSSAIVSLIITDEQTSHVIRSYTFTKSKK